MKKHLLFVFGVGFCISASAQIKSQGVSLNNTNNQNNSTDFSTGNFYQSVKPLSVNKASKNSQRAVTRTKISSSYNGYTLLVTESNCLTADQATNLIMFTHRVSKDWKATGVNSGFIQSTFSTDGGLTWDSILQVQQAAPNLCRYPSGAIFNPSGNTTPGNAFGVVTGPITSGAATNGWQGNYFASQQLNKTNPNTSIRLNATSGVANQFFARVSIQSTDTKVIVAGALYGGDPGATGATAASNKYRGATINYGTPSGSSFTWAVDSIKPTVKTNPTGLNNELSSTALTAWSKNGMIGYLVFFGIPTTATGTELAYQPIVYKTINGGTSWNLMAKIDFSTLPSIMPYLKKSNQLVGGLQSGPKKASYGSNGIDAVVDMNGNLHIIGLVSSGFTTSPDSLDYSFNVSSSYTTSNFLFDTYTTGTVWNAVLIDSLLSASTTTNSLLYSSTGKVATTARIQASISTDRTHIFYMWEDSDPGLSSGENLYPDIYGRGFNVTTGLYTPTVPFTNTGDNYFMYTSNVALVSGTTYKIPTTISLTRNTGTAVTGNVDSTQNHYFIGGIQFDESEFTVGINEITQNGNVGISQNYPNPFSKTTSIDVTLKEIANVSIDVYNTVGQKVISGTPQKISVGTHTLTIDGSRLTAGVYFYTVRAGDAVVTRKMIIQ